MITDAQAKTMLRASETAYLYGPPTSPDQVPAGYQWEQDLTDSTTGFHAKVFRDPNTNEYVIAFAGTEPTFAQAGQDLHADLNLGRTQWEGIDGGRALVFDFLNSLSAPPAAIDFVGGSLGGGLAQYATYEYAQQNPNNLSASAITLVTKNAFGGVDGITQMQGSYDANVMEGINVAIMFDRAKAKMP